MFYKILYLLIFIFLVCCQNQNKIIDLDQQKLKLKKLSVIGDFDGDKKIDTVYQHLFSKLINAEMDSSIDVFYHNFDTVANWFHKQQPDIYLTMKKDTLHLGYAKGLYCLINIGDNNFDKKDEIALVTDFYDYSRINTCIILTICNNRFTKIFDFQIHEDAFNFSSDTVPVFQEIKNFLEKKNGKWFYKDHSKIEGKNLEKMNILKIGNCKNPTLRTP